MDEVSNPDKSIAAQIVIAKNIKEDEIRQKLEKKKYDLDKKIKATKREHTNSLREVISNIDDIC